MQTINVRDLGRKHYHEVWHLQQDLVNQRAQNIIPDQLLVLEHEPVYTIGRKSSLNPALLNLNAPILEVERGGDISFHEPGQLVFYPIFALKEKQRDIRAFLQGLEQVLIHTLASLGFEAQRDSRNTGVWIEGLKVASIGIAVRRWITWHGCAINVNNDLQLAQVIYPCGLPPETMTSLAQLKGQDLPMQDVKQRLIEHMLKWWAERE